MKGNNFWGKDCEIYTKSRMPEIQQLYSDINLDHLLFNVHIWLKSAKPIETYADQDMVTHT